MVYCGKLSKACLPCRKRRLQCDLRTEGCGQCSRARLQCTGYRDTTAVRIEDQTITVQRKAIRCSNSISLTVRTLDHSVCHRARDLFYHDHVVGEVKGYSFLMQYRSPTAGDDYLCRSIDAVSLAYLSHQKHSLCARAEARRHYINALRLIRKALQTPAIATKDSTLLSILLLDVYEKISVRKPRYDGAWASHIRGALSLVRLSVDRDHRQPDRLHMLERLSTNILISCAVSDSVIPDELIVLQRVVTSPLKWRESELMVEFACLKRQAKLRVLSDHEIARSAINLDTQFLELSAQLPPSWQHEEVSVQTNSAHHYEDYHYVYTAVHIGQMWNVLRLTRILICELIFSHCSQSLNHSELDSVNPILEYAITTISQLSREICATVPQLLTQPPVAENHLPCYRLIFPLYVASQSPTASEVMTQYVIQQLRFIADAHGIKDALAVAGILESGERRNPWEVYALLGSYAFVC